MAIAWDVSDIENYKEKYPDKVENEGQENESRMWNPITEALPMLLGLILGVCSLRTDKQVDEAVWRCLFFEGIEGTWFTRQRDDGTEERVSAVEHIIGHKGLELHGRHIMVYTRNQFVKRMANTLSQRATDRFNELKKEREVA